MEYIIIGLLIILIILVIILLLKKNNGKENLDMIERLSRFEVNITKEIGDFKNDLFDGIGNPHCYGMHSESKHNQHI